jgi:hypothetical protein
MAVDGNDGVHLAYVGTSSGGLYYTYISNATSPNPVNARVDTYLSTGQRLMLNVRNQNGNYVPYITYIHNAFTETTNSVRVAWRNTATTADVTDGTTENNTFTGSWEVMTVPARTIPITTELVSNGVPTSNGGWSNPNSTSTLQGYSGGMDRTILVGYMTENWYEGAILKHNIW